LEQGYGMQCKFRSWIYQPWLDELGMDVPKTIDDLYEICKAVAVKDMNGNGDTTDEVAILGNGLTAEDGWGEWFTPLMSAFIYAYDPYYVVVEDGELSLAYTRDEWKEGLTYIKEKFFDEGLISTNVFTNTTEDVKAQLYTELPTVLFYNGWGYDAGINDKIRLNYNYIVGLTNAEGENGYTNYMPILPTSIGAVISSDCENPEAAFLVCDLMCSEHLSLVSRYGTEGEHWAYWDRVEKEDVLNPDNFVAQGGGDIKWVSSYADNTFWSSAESTTASYIQVGPYIRNAECQSYRALQVSADTEERKLALACDALNREALDAAAENIPDEVFDYAPRTTEEQELIGKIEITAMNYVNEMIAAFLTGKKDIDSEWNTYLEELNKIGVYDMLKVYQDAYSRVH